jgi:hypothetical protein
VNFQHRNSSENVEVLLVVLVVAGSAVCYHDNMAGRECFTIIRERAKGLGGIMKIIFSLILTGLFVGTAGAQTPPTPTIEQCRADYAMWNTKIGAGVDSMKSLGHQVLYDRSMTMAVCNVVALNQNGAARMTTKDFEEAVTYTEMSRNYVTELALRFNHYIQRHNEAKQFADEDAAGLR